MKRGDESLENDLNELNEGSDNKDKYDCLEILKLKRNEHVVVDRPGCRGSKEHNEDNRKTHTARLIYLFGNAEEGADAEELLKDVVVYEDSAHKYKNQTLKHFRFPPLLPFRDRACLRRSPQRGNRHS